MTENLNDKLTFIDLFAGCGGLSLGLEQSGFYPLYVNELNSDALAYLKGFTKPPAPGQAEGTKVNGHGNYERFISDLAQIDFLEKVFTARYNLLEGTHG